MSIAFFDLDKTLLTLNSGELWIRRQVREGHISRFQAARAGLVILKYHLGFTSIEEALRRAFATLEGSTAAHWRTQTRRFYEEEVRPLFRKEGLKALQEHRSRGDRIVLLTSSTGYLSECVQEELGMDEILCTRFEVDETGTHTGRLLGSMCYGEGKLTYAKACAEAQGVKLEDCAFYTDSFADISVLEKVGKPVVVNPDRRLRSLAQQKRWPIVDWGAADPTALELLTMKPDTRAAG